MKGLALLAQKIAFSFCLLGALRAEAGPPPCTVVAWGQNTYGQASVPAGLSNVVAVAGGGQHSLALRSDGSVVAWGGNGYGQSNVPPGLSNVVAIAAGLLHSLALFSNGTLCAWGDNSVGQTNIPSGLSDVVGIAAGGRYGLTLRRDGTVAAWGKFTLEGTNSPPYPDTNYSNIVPAGLANVQAIAAGYSHSLALQSNGTVVAWGDNSYGQTNVPPGLSNVMAISAGFGFSVALQSNGMVVAWGANYYGQTNFPLALGSVVAVAAGGYHCLALENSANLAAWGYDAYGQTDFPSGLTNVVAIAAGDSQSLALTLQPLTQPFLLSAPPPVASYAPGASVSLGVIVASASSFGCQWSLSGEPIGGATGTNLSITNFSLAEAGAYSVSVTNQYGSATAACVLRLANSPVVLVDGLDSGGGSIIRGDWSEISMSSAFGSNAEIYYTLDGSQPDFTAVPYSGSFLLTNSATIRAIAYNFAYTDWAEAAPINVQILATYPLSASTPGGGSISIVPAPYSAGNLYFSNAVVTLTATASNGWSFVRWTGDSTATANVTRIIMDGPRTVQALFGTSLSLFTNGSGQILLNPPVGPYVFGPSVKLTALPAAGFYFFGWADAATGFANPLTLNVVSTSGVTALFGLLKSNQVSLTAPVNGSGTVAVNPGTNVYSVGQTVILSASPAMNFTGWSGDASGNVNPLSLTLDTSKLVTAWFGPTSPTNPPPLFQSAALAGSRIVFSWISQPGLVYQVQYKTNLGQAAWSNLGAAVTATNEVMSASDLAQGVGSQRFYRIALLP